MLLREARQYGQPGTVDILVEDGRIAWLRPAGTGHVPAGVAVVDLDGRYAGPGLWDGHIHMTQWAAARLRLDLSAAPSAADAAESVARRLAEGPAVEILLGSGFRDALWPQPPSTDLLDRVAPATPVVLVSGDLHCAWLNSAAANRFGVTLPESGLVREAPWFALTERLSRDAAPGMAEFADAGAAAAARGVVGVVDFENFDNLRSWPQRVEAGLRSLRVDASIWPQWLDEAVAAGHRTGDALDPEGLVRVGPLKVVLDGSLNTRTAWCWRPYPGTRNRGFRSVPAPSLRRLLATAAANGIAVAVHAIGDRANTVALDAFEELAAGMGGTIEHAQQVRPADLGRFAALGVTASIQPEHAMDDRDVAERYWPGRTGFAYGDLHAAGARLRLGSDAPVAPLDPWLAIASAVHRSRDGREPWHTEQCLPVEVALAASAGGRLHLAAGEPADIVVLDHDPLTADAQTLRRMPVAGTLLAGRWTSRDM